MSHGVILAPVYAMSQFGESKTTKSFSQEASMLRLLPGQPPHGQLYPHLDEEVLGLQILTDAGNLPAGLQTWIHLQDDVCGGELQGWRFRPCPETLRLNPHLEGYDLLIIND